MTKFGGHNDNTLFELTRTAPIVEGGETASHALPGHGPRFGGRDETSEHQIVTRLDHMELRVTEHIRENLIPRIVEHNRISIKTDRVPFLYYQKLLFGRRCTCWSAVDSSADKQCPVCFGQSFVGGFRKYGCEWHTLDVTHPSTTLVNVVADFDRQTRPVSYVLSPTAVRGYIETVFDLVPNVGVLDHVSMGSFEPSGTSVVPKLRTSTEAAFVDMTKESTQERLRDALGRPTRLVVRIELRRASPDVALPVFTFLHLRYRTKVDTLVIADIPRREESIELQEHGLNDVLDTITMVMPNELRNIRTEDFFVRASDSLRFKVTRVNRYEPMGVHVGTDVTARHVNATEHYSRIV